MRGFRSKLVCPEYLYEPNSILLALIGLVLFAAGWPELCFCCSAPR